MTGGIGSGKSYVCRLLEQLGYPCYYADDRAKILMVENPELKAEISALLGADAYLATGALNRAHVANRIFAEPSLRAELTARVHPVVAADTRRWIDERKAAGHALAFREAAILFESGADRGCQGVVVVYAPLPVRLERAMKRDARTEPEIRQRMAAQWPEQQKMLAAGYVVYNDSIHPLLPQLGGLLAWAKKLTPAS